MLIRLARAWKRTAGIGGLIFALIAIGGYGYAQHPAIPAPRVAFVAQQSTIPFVLHRGNRIVIDAKVNGQAASGILDSAAGTTAIDRAFARSIGIPEGSKINARGTGGVVEAELVSGVSLVVGGARFDDMTVAVLDLQPVARGVGRPVNLIVGREVFNGTVVSIDWSGSRLTLTEPQAFTPAAGASLVELEKRGPFNTIPLQVGNGTAAPIPALLDIGNGGNISLPKDDWMARPDVAKLRSAESRGGGIGGLHPTRKVMLPEVAVGPGRFRSVPADLGESENDGHATRMANVGIGMLKQFHVDLDLGRQRVYLRQRADAPGFTRDRAGSRLDFHGDRLEVLYVSPQGPSAKAGLKTGDQIVAVDGRKVTPDYYAAPDWTQAEVGRTVELQLIDGRTVRVQLADYY